MNTFISAFKNLLGWALMTPYGTAGFYITAAIVTLGIFLSASWILRAIFGQKQNMFLPFAATFTGFISTLLALAIYKAFIAEHVVNATIDTAAFMLAGGLGMALGARLARFFISIKFAPAVAFLLAMFVAGFIYIFCVSHVYSAIAGAIEKIGDKQNVRTVLPE